MRNNYILRYVGGFTDISRHLRRVWVLTAVRLRDGEEPMATKERVNILMVDDQQAKLLSYEVMLGELDENLIKATSRTEALEHLLKTDVAVVLMDGSMPELDGLVLANMIRPHARFQRTAILLISSVH